MRRELREGEFVLRYRPDADDVEGLPGREGAFLACSFWLANALHGNGRTREAEDLYQRLLAVRNDLGLLAEKYDTTARRQLGNVLQAFSHVALVNTARRLSQAPRPARRTAA